MGYEVKYIYHPRKEEGGYDTNNKEEKFVKVGKPFDDTPLESVAAAIMAQLARRDIWVVDVQVQELVKKDIVYKECKDGKGIMLKGKKYSFNEAAQMVSEEAVEETGTSPEIPPHNAIALSHQSQDVDELYQNPNKQIAIKKSLTPPINQNRVLYKVIFDPSIQLIPEVKRLRLKLTQDNQYPVHHVIQHPTGKLDLQKIAITDDTGRVITVDEKFFTTAGMGLLADKELNFSGSSRTRVKRPKLAFEDEMVLDGQDPTMVNKGNLSYPLDDGSIPDELLIVPEIRSSYK